jgi:hypothetical protein
MTHTEIAQQIAAQHPARVALPSGKTRPANIGDVRKAAKVAAVELGLTGWDVARFAQDAMKAALARDDISTTCFGR